MFTKTVHPLDLLLAVLAAATPGAAIFYYYSRLPFDFLLGIAYLLTAASVMLSVVGGLVWFALRFFGPHRD